MISDAASDQKMITTVHHWLITADHWFISADKWAQ
jgi:hypothetical protein